MEQHDSWYYLHDLIGGLITVLFFLIMFYGDEILDLIRLWIIKRKK